MVNLWPELRSVEDILELEDDEAMGHPEIFFSEAMKTMLQAAAQA